MTIEELESQVEMGLVKVLQPLLPTGYRPHVSLVYPKKDGTVRKARRNASADNWTPESGEIRVYFEPDTTQRENTLPGGSGMKPAESRGEHDRAIPADPVTDLVRALDRTESRPGYQFVALKRFRDVDLPAEGFDWAKSDTTRQTVLRNAIERNLILTSKVPNPKSPQFPVTAIRLNRLLPEVQTILGAQTSQSDFNPIPIRGEALSATVLHERR